MARWMYVGRMDDPNFYWDLEAAPPEKLKIGNVPKAITPSFPPVSRPGYDAQSLTSFIRSGKISGKQTDWGAFVRPVTKQDLLELLEDGYEGMKEYSDGTPFPQWQGQYFELKYAIRHLSDDGDYALVCAEL